MERHWSDYCGLSLVHFLAFPECGSGDGEILKTIESIAFDPFFSGIEISRINDPGTRKRVAQLVEQTRCNVDFGVHPVILGNKLNLNSLDTNERNQACKSLEPYIDQAAELGAKRFVLLSGPDPGEAQRAEAVKVLAESLRCLCESAQARGLSVVLETFDRTVEKKALIGPAEEAAALAAALQVDFPSFGLLYDHAHGVLLDETPLAALSILKNHLVHVHVGNCVKVPGRASYGDSHPRFGFPGSENDIPQLTEFLCALLTMGYLEKDRPLHKRRNVGFEVKPQPGESSAAILANIKRAWTDAWTQLRFSHAEHLKPSQSALAEDRELYSGALGGGA